ncbi:hypothetical protein LCGC14_1579370 [marine sediment metagenome]|uniref:PARP catalytic domain-containing protein n=1 Tax=marine sediment metagenome TaxID=412755 RepID=A0A0F9J3F6_9ZZZZ
MIAYHGTNKENAAAIKQEGFRQGTYFSYRVEDALGFGGNHVFAVEFSADPAKWKGEPDGWQFWTREHIPPSAIVSHGAIEENERLGLVNGLRDLAQGKTRPLTKVRAELKKARAEGKG